MNSGGLIFLGIVAITIFLIKISGLIHKKQPKWLVGNKVSRWFCKLTVFFGAIYFFAFFLSHSQYSHWFFIPVYLSAIPVIARTFAFPLGFITDEGLEKIRKEIEVNDERQ